MNYDDFQSTKHKDWLSKSPLDRNKTSYMLHGVPEETVEEFVVDILRDKAKYIFVTDRREHMYHGFGESWKAFVAAMARPET